MRSSSAAKPRPPPTKQAPAALVPLPEVRFPSDSSLDAPPLRHDFIPGVQGAQSLLRSASKARSLRGQAAQRDFESEDEGSDQDLDSAGAAVSALLLEQSQVGKKKAKKESRAHEAGFCEICMQDIPDWGDHGFSFCYSHSYCLSCSRALACARLGESKLPRCPEPKCKCTLDAASAEFLLGPGEDLNKFLELAIWSQLALQACPECRAPLWSAEPPTSSRQSGQRTREPIWNFTVCSHCGHEFCHDCLGPRHAETLTCDEAHKLQNVPGGDLDLTNALASSLVDGSAARQKALPTPMPESPAACHLPQRLRACAGNCLPEQAGDSVLATLSLDDEGVPGPVAPPPLKATSTLRNTVGEWQECPRCCRKVIKDDNQSCDHITCPVCMHEFCWNCLADRDRILKHGNHYHRSWCAHYACGPKFKHQAMVYAPGCGRCRRRGFACRPFHLLSQGIEDPLAYTFHEAAAAVTQVADALSLTRTCSGSSNLGRPHGRS